MKDNKENFRLKDYLEKVELFLSKFRFVAIPQTINTSAKGNFTNKFFPLEGILLEKGLKIVSSFAIPKQIILREFGVSHCSFVLIPVKCNFH